ncbi:unnamed protein product [Clavelina lepadiformis]|uniref:Uncharacterized protein n=1 Tax=Clavelina lepadiformis TaxID=159417 RepID=A0ABP0EYH9_CLALP
MSGGVKNRIESAVNRRKNPSGEDFYAGWKCDTSQTGINHDANRDPANKISKNQPCYSQLHPATLILFSTTIVR